MTENQPLTDKTLERIRALAKGNGLAAERITVLESEESVHKVRATVQIEPHLDVKSRVVLGRPKLKNVKTFPDFAAMDKEIESIRKSFNEGTEWAQKAVEEVRKSPSQGWGEDGTEVTWDSESSFLAATENCPTCRGTATSTCPYCQGLGFKVCHYCEGRGKELCPHCGGRGEDPVNQGQPCSICRGERYAECRYCHLSGKLPCENCNGKATLPCTDCKGTGFVTRESKVVKKAVLRFSLGKTTELPSGLLRMMQRIGVDKMAAGLADIEMVQPGADPESGIPPNLLGLTASIPYAEIKMKIGSKTGKIIAFGKSGRLSGVPPFLDDVLGPARGLLVKAAKGEIVLEKVLGLRVMKNALSLSLEGKTNPNELRRIYPVGLTGEAAKDIMTQMGLAIRTQTKSVRNLIGSSYATLCALLFAVFDFSPAFALIASAKGTLAALSVSLLLLVATLGGGWLVLSNAARWALRQKYPDAKIGRIQEIGRTGYYVLGVITVVHFVLLFAAGHLSALVP